MASNSYTKYRPYPSPAQFASSPDLISRTTSFLRRELQVWEGLDVEVRLQEYFSNFVPELSTLVPHDSHHIVDESNRHSFRVRCEVNI